MTRKYPDAPSAVSIRAWAITLVVCAIYGGLVLPLDKGSDLAPLLVAARLVADGKIAAIYAHDPGYLDIFEHDAWINAAQRVGYSDARHYAYVYPPLWAGLLAPITRFADFATIYWIFGPLNLVAIGAMVLVVAMQWNPLFLRALPLLLCLIAVFASYPVFKTALLGQMQPMVVMAVVAAMAASQRNRPVAAGAALAFAAAIKLVPAVVAVYWLFAGRRRCAIWFAASGGALVLLSLAVAGWAPHIAFIEALGRIGTGYAVGMDNQSLIAWLGEAFERSAPQRTIPIREMPAWTRMAVALAAVACIAALMRQAPRDRAADALTMFSLFLAASLAAPFAWLHYLFCLAVPLMILSSRWHGAVVALGIGGFLSLPAVLRAISLENEGQAHLLRWSGLIACLLVLILSVARIRQSGAQATSAPAGLPNARDISARA